METLELILEKEKRLPLEELVNLLLPTPQAKNTTG